MEISSRRSMSLDLDPPVVAPVASSYPPMYGNCRTNMYATQGMRSSADANIPKAYGMKNSLSIDSATTSVKTPKKDNFFTSMFGALTSIVIDHFGKVPSSFVSNIHNTLSVTVVPNEGIISQEFFKSLTRSCDHLATDRNNDTLDKLPNKTMYDVNSSMSHIFTDEMTKFPISTKTSTNIKCRSTEEPEKMKRLIDNELVNCPLISSEIFKESEVTNVPDDTRVNEDSMSMKKNSLIMKDDEVTRDAIATNMGDVITNSTIDEKNKSKVSSPSRSAVPKTMENIGNVEFSDQKCKTGWQTMWRKVVNGMSERFNTYRAISPDSEVPMKKANLSKPPRRKTCTIARGRGKGRGKSQLRRSGVSQSRHRKERTKQNIYSNIQDDLNAWEDCERYEESEDEESSPDKERQNSQGSSSSLGDRDSSSRLCSTLFDDISFDVSSNLRKRKQRMRVRYVPESAMEIENSDVSYNIDKDCSSRLDEYRPRLISESSVDSEDSYCIVFENSSETNYSDYDDVSDETSDTISDDDFDDDEKETQTVRFNLKPQIHTMIKWDYAYRAARRGPWEEMARDRERFRGRIHCIERILNPILSIQHRNQIWQKRFDVDEGSGRSELKLF